MKTIATSLVLLSASSLAWSADRAILISKVVNKYGFKSVGTNFSDCRKINRSLIKKVRKCYYQGKKHDDTGRKFYSFVQYKCSLGKTNGEIYIYNTRRTCQRQYDSMLIESN